MLRPLRVCGAGAGFDDVGRSAAIADHTTEGAAAVTDADGDSGCLAIECIKGSCAAEGVEGFRQIDDVETQDGSAVNDQIGRIRDQHVGSGALRTDIAGLDMHVAQEVVGDGAVILPVHLGAGGIEDKGVVARAAAVAGDLAAGVLLEAGPIAGTVDLGDVEWTIQRDVADGIEHVGAGGHQPGRAGDAGADGQGSDGGANVKVKGRRGGAAVGIANDDGGGGRQGAGIGQGQHALGDGGSARVGVGRAEGDGSGAGLVQGKVILVGAGTAQGAAVGNGAGSIQSQCGNGRIAAHHAAAVAGGQQVGQSLVGDRAGVTQLEHATGAGATQRDRAGGGQGIGGRRQYQGAILYGRAAGVGVGTGEDLGASANFGEAEHTARVIHDAAKGAAAVASAYGQNGGVGQVSCRVNIVENRAAAIEARDGFYAMNDLPGCAGIVRDAGGIGNPEILMRGIVGNVRGVLHIPGAAALDVHIASKVQGGAAGSQG